MNGPIGISFLGASSVLLMAFLSSRLVKTFFEPFGISLGFSSMDLSDPVDAGVIAGKGVNPHLDLFVKLPQPLRILKCLFYLPSRELGEISAYYSFLVATHLTISDNPHCRETHANLF